MHSSVDDLPLDIQAKVREVGVADPAAWVLTPIPALGGRSIVEVMNDANGRAQVTEFLLRVIGKFS